MMTSTNLDKNTFSPEQSLLSDFYPLTPPMETLQMPTDFFFSCDASNTPDSFGTLDFTNPSLLAPHPFDWSYEDLLMPLMDSATPDVLSTEKPIRTSTKPGAKKLKTESVLDGARHYCTDCPASFASKYHMKRHEKKHSEKNKWSCTVAGCKVTSHRSDNMAKHIDTHTKRLAKQNGQREKFVQRKQSNERARVAVPEVQQINIVDEIMNIGQQQAIFPVDDVLSLDTFFNGIMDNCYSSNQCLF
jgi:uncharacterized Zn-finger protein